jgi:hypothetical protein
LSRDYLIKNNYRTLLLFRDFIPDFGLKNNGEKPRIGHLRNRSALWWWGKSTIGGVVVGLWLLLKSKKINSDSYECYPEAESKGLGKRHNFGDACGR